MVAVFGIGNVCNATAFSTTRSEQLPPRRQCYRPAGFTNCHAQSDEMSTPTRCLAPGTWASLTMGITKRCVHCVRMCLFWKMQR